MNASRYPHCFLRGCSKDAITGMLGVEWVAKRKDERKVSSTAMQLIGRQLCQSHEGKHNLVWQLSQRRNWWILSNRLPIRHVALSRQGCGIVKGRGHGPSQGRMIIDRGT